MQRTFDEQGFVTTRLLSRDKAEQIRERLFAIHDGRDVGLDPANPKRTNDASLFHPDRDYRHQAEELVRSVLAERVAALLCGYRFLLGSILLKRAGGDAVDMHRDWTMTADARQTTLNCWCPLVDVDEANGALALVPGSHNLLAADVHGPGTALFFGPYGERLKHLSRIVPLAAGEAMIFDYRLLHWSPANGTCEPRPALSGGFVPKAARPLLHVADEAHPRRRLQLIEPETEEWTDTLFNLFEPGRPGLRLVGEAPARSRTMGPAEIEGRLAASGSSAIYAGLRLRDSVRALLGRARRMLWSRRPAGARQ